MTDRTSTARACDACCDQNPGGGAGTREAVYAGNKHAGFKTQGQEACGLDHKTILLSAFGAHNPWFRV